MDGFAVRAADVAGAMPDSPGDAARSSVRSRPATRRAVACVPGTAMRVLTGAMLPPGADAVVPVEDTDAAPGVAALPTERGRAPRRPPRASTCAAPGATCAPASRCSARARRPPGHAGAAGRRRARHGACPPAPAGGGARDGRRAGAAPGEPLGPARSPTATRPMLAAQAQRGGRRGAPPRHRARRRGAGPRALRGRAGMRPTCVVVSGGVSVGAHDVVKAAFEAVGRHRRSGGSRSSRASRSPSPRGATHGWHERAACSGCPGNPVSSFVTFELFVRPVLRRAGRPTGSGRAARCVRGSADRCAPSTPGRRSFLRVHAPADGRSGRLAWRRSGRRSGLARAVGTCARRWSGRRARGVRGAASGSGGRRDLALRERADGLRAGTRCSDRRRLSHVDRRGRPRMVDVSAKPSTARRAVAEAWSRSSQETLQPGHRRRRPEGRRAHRGRAGRA